MSLSDLPPGACYVPEMHLRPYWVVVYNGVRMIMTDIEFGEFLDHAKYDGVEYEATVVHRTSEYFDSCREARL